MSDTIVRHNADAHCGVCRLQDHLCKCPENEMKTEAKYCSGCRAVLNHEEHPDAQLAAAQAEVERLKRYERLAWKHGTDADDHARELNTLRPEIVQLKAEVERLKAFQGCDGCSTGDCPHDSVHDCVAAQGKIIEADTAEIERLKAQIAQLRGSE